MRLLIVVSLIASTSIALAQTQEQISACSTDAMKFYSAEISQDHSAARACLEKHRRQVSKECADALAQSKH